MKRALILIAGMLSALSAFSQTGFDTASWRKPVALPQVSDSISSFHLSGEYSIEEKEFRSLYRFTPYDGVKPARLEIDKVPSFHARAGFRFPMMPLLDLDWRKMFDENSVFGLSAHHHSQFGELPSASGAPALDREMMHNSVGATYNYAWREGEFNAGVDYSYDRYSYSDSKSRWVSSSLGNFGFRARLRSTDASDNDLYYDFKFAYDMGTTDADAPWYDSSKRLGEHKMTLNGYVGTTFDVHRICVDMDIRSVSYFDLKNYTVASVHFSPMYELSLKRFSGRFGVKFGNRFGMEEGKTYKASDGNVITAMSTIFPNVDARYCILPGYLWTHLTVTGGYELNEWSSLSRFCPLADPTGGFLVGSNPVDARLRLEATLFGRLSLNLQGGFRVDNGRPWFEPESSDGDLAKLKVCSMDVNTLDWGFDLLWKSESVAVGGQMRFNSYFSSVSDEVTQLPARTARFYTRYNWRRRIVAAVDLNCRSGVRGAGWASPPVVDLSLELGWTLSRSIRIYAKAGNILNRDNRYVPVYGEPGFNLGGGIALTY